MIRENNRKSLVYEHLEYYLKHTTPLERMIWLKQANNFVREVLSKGSLKLWEKFKKGKN